MSAGVVMQQLQIQQAGFIQDELLADNILVNLQFNPLPSVIETLVEHPPYPTEALSLALDDIGDGGWLLIRGGQVSTLTADRSVGLALRCRCVEHGSPRTAHRDQPVCVTPSL